jgi:hypothetical protein
VAGGRSLRRWEYEGADSHDRDLRMHGPKRYNLILGSAN